MTCAGVEAALNTRNVIMIRTKNAFQSITPRLVKPPLERDKVGGSHLLPLSSVSQRYEHVHLGRFTFHLKICVGWGTFVTYGLFRNCSAIPSCWNACLPRSKDAWKPFEKPIPPPLSSRMITWWSVPSAPNLYWGAGRSWHMDFPIIVPRYLR